MVYMFILFASAAGIVGALCGVVCVRGSTAVPAAGHVTLSLSFAGINRTQLDTNTKQTPTE